MYVSGTTGCTSCVTALLLHLPKKAMLQPLLEQSNAIYRASIEQYYAHKKTKQCVYGSLPAKTKRVARSEVHMSNATETEKYLVTFDCENKYGINPTYEVTVSNDGDYDSINQSAVAEAESALWDDEKVSKMDKQGARVTSIKLV